MNNENWFDYLTKIFDEEHNLIRVILVGEDCAIRVLAKEDSDEEDIKEEFRKYIDKKPWRDG